MKAMILRRIAEIALFAGLVACASVLRAEQLPGVEQVALSAGKSHLIDTTVDIDRVTVAAPEVAEAVPVSPRTLVINGKQAGETSLVLWMSDGTRRQFDLVVSPSTARVTAARLQLEREFADRVQLTVDNGSAFLTGKVKNLYASGRAVAIAEAAGKVINLLNVDIPPQEQQILLKVRFADVDRSKSLELGINFYGAPGGIPFTSTVGTFSPTRLKDLKRAGGAVSSVDFNVADALNVWTIIPHLDLGATLKDLQAKNVLQILAEPNVLAMNGHEASFVTGGEFPYPTLQGGGGGVGQVTVQFREFGVRIHFTPTITPRGTIRLHVTPEVSSLDYANALTVSGVTVPGLSTRRIETEIELEDGQSFVIAGLLDQRTTETLSKMPGFSEIPILGKLFQTKSINRAHSELLILVTPELVSPIPADKELPDLERPLTFLEGNGTRTTAPRTPGRDVTGPPVTRPRRDEIPVQEMENIELQQRPAPPFTATPAFAAPARPNLTVALPGAVPTATDPVNTPRPPR